MIEPGLVPPPDDLLWRAGGKAYGLLKLSALGFPVPTGFVLPTTMCQAWIGRTKPSVAEFKSAYGGTLERLERVSGLRFGDLRKPLLVAVRSGAPLSMPGMLDTVLNVGLTLSAVPGFIALTGNPRLAWDCYRRLIESYAQSVCGIDLAPFEAETASLLSSAGVSALTQLDTIAVRELAMRQLQVFLETTGARFPDDPYVQLLNAVDAVFRSWNSERAKAYRRISALDDLPGTAVTVQSMVFGNAGGRSGAGVGFTRNPATGEKGLYVDFAFDAQGEDVVAGRKRVSTDRELHRILPQVVSDLKAIAAKLEQAFGYAQDFEFTVTEGQLFLLQTRDAKCSDWARLKIAVDLVEEGLITPIDALRRLKDLKPERLVRKRLVCAGKAIATGVPAGIGVASGAIVFTVKDAKALTESGRSTILVRADISADDVEGIAAATGVLTARGGRTSHAAVVAREFGKVAVVGCSDLHLADDNTSCTIGEIVFKPGAELTLDGESGAIYSGEVKIVEDRPEAALAKWNGWKAADGKSKK